MGVEKKYPTGFNQYATVAPIVTDAFQIDFGLGTTSTFTHRNYPAGSQILSWAGRMAEAAESGSAGTLAIGFTGTVLVSSSLTTGDMTLGAWIGPSTTHEDNLPLLLTSDDTFDTVIATDSYTAGKVDVYVTYIPLPKCALDTNEFTVYVTT